MLLLGIDLGTSFIKATVVDAESQNVIATAQYPDKEANILSKEIGWAEQSPEHWWECVKQAILKAHSSKKYNPLHIKAIGISYQMHGLVIVNKNQEVLRDAIIWCDSRAVEIGNNAFEKIGKTNCLSAVLNSPGNFTASKLAWVKQNEPLIYQEIDKMMLPGDFIAMKLTGKVSTTISSLSEGVFWDFQKEEISKDILSAFEFDKEIIPEIMDTFSNHGEINKEVANVLGISEDVIVSYKAGDQPNNAFSLNVLNPGEVAATAGTSGVIYGVTDELKYDPQSRVNTFAHINHHDNKKRLGVLLCINGTGILNRWVKDHISNSLDYAEINKLADQITEGSDGLQILPFGNGAERMLNNIQIGAHFLNIDFNRHTQSHIFRAVQEGICFAFRYGLDAMKTAGIQPKVIKAGKANMFLSEVFAQTFVNVCNTPVELYNNDGSVGAALGAGVGCGIYANFEDAFKELKPLKLIQPSLNHNYEELYINWKIALENKLKNHTIPN